MAASGTASLKVVAHFLDGRILKGTTHDFSPDKDHFHLVPEGGDRSHAVAVPIPSLKAVFFVKSFKGNKYQVDDASFRLAGDRGRPVRIRFKDRETIAALAPGSTVGRAGFFVVPADPRSNNQRIFVVHGSVEEVEWVDRPPAARTGTRIS